MENKTITITEEDFDKAVKKCLDHITKPKSDKLDKDAILKMCAKGLIAANSYAMLQAILFNKEEKKD